MTRSNPASAAWAAYFRNHLEVAANWGEQNDRLCNCQCPACMDSRTELGGIGFAPIREGSIFDPAAARL